MGKAQRAHQKGCGYTHNLGWRQYPKGMMYVFPIRRFIRCVAGVKWLGVEPIGANRWALNQWGIKSMGVTRRRYK